jgi:hypothetical protein
MAYPHRLVSPSLDGSTESPNQAAGQLGGSGHKRVYQACIPCRRRKVKCDLGSVDNPGDPPCVRCRRESKECYFSATRRKRKNEDDDDNIDGSQFPVDYLRRNARKGTVVGSSPPPTSIRQTSIGAPVSARPAVPYDETSANTHGPPLTPGGSIGRLQPLRRPQSNGISLEQYEQLPDDSNTHVENLEAQAVMRKQVFGPHDAMELLYKAATDRYG